MGAVSPLEIDWTTSPSGEGDLRHLLAAEPRLRHRLVPAGLPRHLPRPPRQHRCPPHVRGHARTLSPSDPAVRPSLSETGKTTTTTRPLYLYLDHISLCSIHRNGNTLAIAAGVARADARNRSGSAWIRPSPCLESHPALCRRCRCGQQQDVWTGLLSRKLVCHYLYKVTNESISISISWCPLLVLGRLLLLLYAAER